jgi:hypothetical protein
MYMSQSKAFRETIEEKLVPKDANFRGRTQSSWMSEWVQWMHGHSVNYTGLNGEILFTRGGLSYAYQFSGGPRIQIGPDYKEEVFITSDVPIYVNVRTAFYFVGEPHPFGTLNTLSNVIAACRDDHSRGRLTRNEIIKLVNPENIDDKANIKAPLNSNYIESFGIIVTVDPNSLLADQFEFPVERGSQLTGCAVGEICILDSLPNGDYVIATANTGARGYQSSSTFVIHVGPKRFMSPF